MPREFRVSTEGQNRLGLKELCQAYVGQLWMADHFPLEEATESALDQFKRAVAQELEVLVVECRWALV